MGDAMNSIVLASIWALVATLVAFLPIRWQFAPGILLLVTAPLIIVALGVQHGWGLALAGTAGFVSMFRKPLRHYWRRWKGIDL